MPRGAANLVSTTFAANALLDAYDYLGDDTYLQVARNTADYIVDHLYYTEENEVASFRYPLPEVQEFVREYQQYQIQTAGLNEGSY